MSADPVIAGINASRADVLTVFLSARKAQAFLLQNHERLEVPVRAQLGATINIQAGVVRRAPELIQRLGFEWLWRVKEEPYLWRRYLSDGRGLAWLFCSSVLPICADHLLRSLRPRAKPDKLVVEYRWRPEVVQVRLVGPATAEHVSSAVTAFRQALQDENDVVIDLSRVTSIDARFFGLLLMMRKQQLSRGRRLSFAPVPRRTARLFRINRFDFLLN